VYSETLLLKGPIMDVTTVEGNETENETVDVKALAIKLGLMAGATVVTIAAVTVVLKQLEKKAISGA
jgi:hypothetical protein